MKALVTGCGGFLGRQFSIELRSRGWTVRGMDISGTYPYDVLDYFRFPGKPPERFDLVVHCAARAPHRAAIDGQPASAVYNQLLDTALFEWAIRTEQSRVLYISSCAVYPASLQCGCEPDIRLAESHRYDQAGGPPDAYGWTKLAGEKMAAAANRSDVPTHIVRPFSGYGASQGESWPFGAFAARARRHDDPFVLWGTGEQIRDWIHVSDVVAGALAVVDADVREPVNLCTGVGTSIYDLACAMTRQAGYAPRILTDATRPAGVAWRIGDPSRMRDIYTPRIDLAEGVRLALGRAG